MALKSILVQVGEDKNGAGRIELAAKLAADHGAHLTGVYVARPAYLPPYLAAEVGPEVFDAQKKMAAEAAAEAEARFGAVAKRAGVEWEWRADSGVASDVTAVHARYADITVVGQTDPEGEGAAVEEVAEHLVLDAGRPVLVIPYAGKYAQVGERVMVAWNASREAARAVNDALPILERAKQVTVLAVNPKGGPKGHGDIPGADITLHLTRHGVKAEATHIFADDIEVGNMLLSRVADTGVDLLVMGAYGRSRLRELIMGGVSRSILRHMTVPVLMSH